MLHQFSTAQKLQGSRGHATKAGSTEQQPFHYDFSESGYGFPQPVKFEDKLEEREYLKGRLAAAFRIFGQRGFDEGVAGHITVRVCRYSKILWPAAYSHQLRIGSSRTTYDVGKSLWSIV